MTTCTCLLKLHGLLVDWYYQWGQYVFLNAACTVPKALLSNVAIGVILEPLKK